MSNRKWGFTWKAEHHRMVEECSRLANHRARLKLALEMTLTLHGVPEEQAERIAQDVQACNFNSLKKAIKYDKNK